MIPLAVIEAYFAAQRRSRAWVKVAVAVLVLVLAMSGVTAIGAFGTVTILWRPYL